VRDATSPFHSIFAFINIGSGAGKRSENGDEIKMLKAGGGQGSGARAALVLLVWVLVGNAAPVVVARVQDGETKRPLAGAMVISEGSDIMAVTDSAGRCVVAVAPKRGGALVASRQGYMDQTLAGVWPTKSAQDTAVIDFRLYPNGPAPVGGVVGRDTVVVPSGAAVPAVGLAPARAGGGSAVSDTPSGPRKVEAAAPPEAELAEVNRTEAAEAGRSLVGAPDLGSVAGVVSDIKTGLPVPEVHVAVDGTEFAASTDSAGRYVIERVPVGMHKLLVTRAGYVNAYTVVRLVKDWVVTVNLYLRNEVPKSVPGK
jgi:hypothetical protein